MSGQDHVDELSLLEAFRLAAWGKNSFIKESIRKSSEPGLDRAIECHDFGEHLCAVQLFCPAVDDKLVVFQEYRVAMDRFKKGDAAYETGACITGQPGIGKTCFIAYAVVIRLLEEQPVAVQVSWSRTQLKYLLFSANAVTLHDEDKSLPLYAFPDIWTFSDSDSAALEPNLAFQNSRSNVRIFQTASPTEQRWKQWTKQCSVDLYVMDVLSYHEIEDLAVILGKDAKLMKAFTEKWGPVPRILLWLLKLPSRQKVLEENVAYAVSKATENPGVIFDAIADHKSSTVRGLSTVFFIRPTSKTERATTSAYVPTRWLADALVSRLRLCSESQRMAFFRFMSPYKISVPFDLSRVL